MVAQAAFPFFSSIQQHRDLLRKGFLATVRYSQLAVVPICIGLFITAEPLVAVTFGSQWSEAVPILRIMAVFMLTASVGVNIGDVYKAIGRPDVLAKLAIVDFVVLAPALVAGAHLGGLIGIAWAHALVSAVDTLIRLEVARRMVGVRFSDVGRAMSASIRAGSVLAIVAGTTMSLAAPLSDLARLLITAVVGMGAYAVAVWVFDRAALVRIAGWVGVERFVPGGDQ